MSPSGQVPVVTIVVRSPADVNCTSPRECRVASPGVVTGSVIDWDQNVLGGMD